MPSRDTDLVSLRAEILSTVDYSLMGFDEKFQNKTIRPIIKLQRDLLLAVFKNYTVKHKSAFYMLSVEKKMVYIENAIQKDIKFRNSLKGMIIGQFTIEEYELYIKNSSSLNKRMMGIVIEDLKNNLQLLEMAQPA